MSGEATAFGGPTPTSGNLLQAAMPPVAGSNHLWRKFNSPIRAPSVVSCTLDVLDTYVGCPSASVSMLAAYWVGRILPMKPLLSITEQMLTLRSLFKCKSNVKLQQVGHPRTLSALCCWWHRPGKAVAPPVESKLLYPYCVRPHITLFVHAP